MQNHWQNQGRHLVSVASCNPRLAVFVDSLCFGVGEKVRPFSFRYNLFSFAFFVSYLNSLWALQIGGVENPGISYPNLNYAGFVGCIRKITNNEHVYDLKTPLKVVNAPEGCQDAFKCPNCNNHGYCEPSMAKASVCVCDVGYSGTDCLKSKLDFQ